MARRSLKPSSAPLGVNQDTYLDDTHKCREAFYVLEGTLGLQLGQRTLELTEGTFVSHRLVFSFLE